MSNPVAEIEALLQKRQVKKAERLIARGLRASLPNMDQARLLLLRARTRLLNGRPEGAIDDLSLAREISGADYEKPDTLTLVADCYFARFELSPAGFVDRADAALAQQTYQQVIERFPDYEDLGWVYYQLGRVMLTDTKIESAVDALQKALLAPSHVPALTAYCYERLGFVAFYEQRDQRQALVFLSKAVDTYPADEDPAWLAQVHILRSRILRENHQHEPALVEAQHALRLTAQRRPTLRDGYAEALLTTGELLSRMRAREEEVIEHLSQFLQVSRKPLGTDVTWSRVSEMLADAYLSTGQYEKAINAYRAALHYNPFHPWNISVYFRIAQAHYRQGNYTQALTVVREALDAAHADGQDVDHKLYTLYANAFFALGQYANAVEAYELALQTAATNTEILDKLKTYHQTALDRLNQA